MRQLASNASYAKKPLGVKQMLESCAWKEVESEAKVHVCVARRP